MADGPDLEERVAALEAALGPAADFALLPLRPDEIRQLLRECVTVVKPGETLVVRVPWAITPQQLYEYQRVMDSAEGGAIPFKVLVVAGDELGVVQPESDETFAVRVMGAINAMDVHASVDGGGYVRAHAKFKGNGQWWPSDDARKAQGKP